MDYLTAAETVLRAEGRPLHFRDIARHAVERQLITPSGLTPDATMGSRLYVDTQKPDSRFERRGKGTFALRPAAPADDIARRVEAINSETRAVLRQRLQEMPAARFEVLISQLLLALGFDEATIEVTSYAGDGGIDVRGTLNAGGLTQVNAAVQVKRWKRNVQTGVVRDVRGSLTTHEQGIIITTSGFSSGARDEARAVGKAPISLIDGPALIELLIDRSIGVLKQSPTVVTLDREWWAEAAGDQGGAAEAAAPDAEPATPPAAPIPNAAPARRLAQGVFPLAVRGPQTSGLTGLLLDGHGRLEFGGQTYGTPTAAALAASGQKSINGWRYWHYQHPDSGAWRPIAELRAP